MKTIWFPYWGGMVDVKVMDRIPVCGRYLCTDFDEGMNFYDIGRDYIVGVAL